MKSFCLMLGIFLASTGISISASAADSIADQLKAALAAGPVVEIAGEKVPTAPLVAYYEPRDYAPRWFSFFGLKGDAKKALRVIARAGEHGLDPERYHSKRIEDILDN